MNGLIKENIKSILRNIRPLRTIHFMVMVSLGCYFSRNFQLVTWILCLITIFLAWQYNIHVNDIFDIEIDRVSNVDRPLVRGKVSRRAYMVILIGLLSCMFVITIIIGWISVLIATIFIGLGTIYSVPPFRARQYIFQTMFIGAGSMVAFFLGVFSLNTTMSSEIFLIGLLIFLGLSIGTVVKDYKDYEGDKTGDVKSIFTKFGLRRGLIISYVLLSITFLLPLILIHQITDFIIIIGFAILTTLVFKMRKNVKYVFFFYFIVLSYTFLRYEGFLIMP